MKLSKYVTQIPDYIDSSAYYTTQDLHNTVNETDIPTYPTIPSFKEIIDQNEQSLPVEGSFVEYVDQITRKIKFGVVLKPSDSKFDDNYNRIMVLTMENSIEMVSPTHINYQLYQIVRPDWIGQMRLDEYRTEADLPARLYLVEVLKYFIQQSLEFSEDLSAGLSLVHSQYSKKDNIVPISILEIIESLKFSNKLLNKISDNYFQQSILLMSIHLFVSNSPLWIQSSNLPNYRLTNIVQNGCTNALIYGSNYFLNSISNSQSIDRLNQVSGNEILMREANDFLTKLYNDQQSSSCKSYDDLNFYVTIWEGRHFKFIIDCLKFFIIYPHSVIARLLSKFDVFKDTPVTPGNVYSFLERLKLYNNSQNQLTDIFLSANIIGKPALSQLALSTPGDVQVPSNSEAISSNQFTDKFPHLRKEKSYYKDHVVYGIPILKDPSMSLGSSLAVSLEKVNSRRYTINIHIPDIATKLSPSSDLFNELLQDSISMKSLGKLLQGEQMNKLFDKKLEGHFRFPNQATEEENNWYRVGDIPSHSHNSGMDSRSVTCLTVSLSYNTFDSNPFSNLQDKISISFDSLASVKIKNIQQHELEECLEGKADVSPFRIFKRTVSPSREGQSRLNTEDIHNIGFIYNVLKSHFKIRNLNGASIVHASKSLDPEDSSDMIKDLSYANSGRTNERLITKIELKNSAKKFSRSKFFVDEIESMVASITSLYCAVNKIPVYSYYQENLYDELNPTEDSKAEVAYSKGKDSVLVSHDNLFLPNYYADSFYQTLISRDANGYVSLPANIIGRSFLGKVGLEVSSNGLVSGNLPMGLSNGYVDIIHALDDFEVILNQLQILNFVQLQFHNSFVKRTQSHLENINKSSYLKGYGYNVRGPFESVALTQQQDKIIDSKKLVSFLQTIHKRFWTLKMLEQKLVQEEFEKNSVTEGASYECIITHTGYEVPDMANRISRGFCTELGIEVDVLNSTHNNINIGTVVKCDKVLYFDVVSGACVLKEEQVF
ncbi:uncharacterized protein CANTADRAFT_89476 [Suhomyces tanzawaensis NRRL Y-17324]|uniref:RNB-domain-containing protein n=1 Tax=Suhomyces tanzawaensis NRRL Y-17324 TaxID=984487 RepID=A0A1E4SK36_9ASCO|nr:uncharacterized protein CANTADRAFT_89476 [Suhomyces tanzawaensis NRRL Y-17324]ODV79858.1 hypothetical protein CANTADRAFT_89476 [Suhomyces tanzawaensis NRRL Y-17324]